MTTGRTILVTLIFLGSTGSAMTAVVDSLSDADLPAVQAPRGWRPQAA